MFDNLLVVCTFTKDSIYEEEAQRMVQSAERFGYRARAIEVPEQGDWRRNVGIKPTHIYQAIQEHNGPVLSLDSDCLILKPLDELFQLAQNADIAVKCRPELCFTGQFNAAVLLVQQTPAALSVVREWAERGGQHCHLHRFAEQGAFVEGMTLNQRDLRVFPLPERFHCDTVDGAPAPDDCVICHNKISRQTLASMPTTTKPAPAQPRNAVYCMTKPAEEPTGGRPLFGVRGAVADFTEFASRHGIEQILNAGIPSKQGNGPTFDLKKLDVIAKLSEQAPAGTPVVLANYDTLFLRDPKIFEEALTQADLAVAWDVRNTSAIPDLSVFSFRLSPRLKDFLIPKLRQECQRILVQGPCENLLDRAMGNILRSPEHGLTITAFGANTIDDLSTVNHATTVLTVRSQLQFNRKGTSSCPPPLFLRRTSKNGSFTNSVSNDVSN